MELYSLQHRNKIVLSNHLSVFTVYEKYIKEITFSNNFYRFIVSTLEIKYLKIKHIDIIQLTIKINSNNVINVFLAYVLFCRVTLLCFEISIFQIYRIVISTLSVGKM